MELAGLATFLNSLICHFELGHTAIVDCHVDDFFMHTLVINGDKTVSFAKSVSETVSSDGIFICGDQNESMVQKIVERGRGAHIFAHQSISLKSLSLRLDSRLFLYDNLLSLAEAYKIKHSKPVVKSIGHWNSTLESLQIPVKDIWERRKNLYGTELVDSTIPGENWNANARR